MSIQGQYSYTDGVLDGLNVAIGSLTAAHARLTVERNEVAASAVARLCDELRETAAAFAAETWGFSPRAVR